jgi:hypothetical protein
MKLPHFFGNEAKASLWSCLKRIDRAAGKLNPWLFGIAVALGFGEISTTIWKLVASMPPPH